MKNLIENQRKIQTSTSSKTIDEPKELRPLKENQKDWDRNSKIAKESLEDAHFKCELNTTHKTFTTKKKVAYMEAHHLIPMEFQEKFKYSLDIKANLISLCPNCHRQLHNAIMEEKKDLLIYLYNNRINRLKKCNLDITIDELLSFYD